jgi:Ser-Thr-rich glycosyl-phosphatidyl-inositol-anchored membrane family
MIRARLAATQELRQRRILRTLSAWLAADGDPVERQWLVRPSYGMVDMRGRRLRLKVSKGLARLTIAGIVSAAAAVATSGAVAANGWAVVNSPNQGGSQNVLTSVACANSTSCVAVGSVSLSSVSQTLIESWNGVAWSLVASPNNGTGNNTLNGVSCTSTTSCIAVGAWLNGSLVQDTLVESWNGSTWTSTPSPNKSTTDSNVLNGIACTSSISCVAVGYYFNSGVQDTLVESWNGTTWSIVSSPNPGTAHNVLASVACTSSTSCVAVGFYVTGSSAQTLVENWNGTSWSITPSPNPGTTRDYLSGVFCTSSTSCMAVGYYYNGSSVAQTLVERWNGTSWSITASPNQGSGGDFFSGVACTGATSCTAVGYYSNGSVAQTLIERWDGTSWSTIASPNEGGSANVLTGVACTSSLSCMAAGLFVNGSNADQTLIERWNGTSWSITASPNTGGSDNSLSAVKCTSSTSCMAVGAYSNGSVQQTLVEGWNGSIWAVIASPNLGSSSNALSGVSCTSSTSCVAVGTYAKAGVEQTLVENWNGTNWTIATSPNSGTGSNILSSVACASSTSCVAVGYYFNASSIAQTLVESWTGSAWTISSSPNRPSSTNSLAGVSCTSASACTAVGASVNGASIAQTLVENWNGTSWSISSSLNPGVITNELNGVKCTSSTSCMAVGDYYNASNVDQTLVERWNGSTWAVVASPDQGTRQNYLSGIACPSATSCVAVGFFRNASSVPQTLVESWNGSTWAIVASPNPSGSSTSLSGVACPSSTSCTAVGAYTSSGAFQTLVETGPASAVSTSITVTAPTTGVSWARGSTHAITWSSTGGPGANVKIQLLQSGVVVKTITTSVSTSAGTFTWKVPSTLSPATTYQIKIVSTTNAKVFGISGKFSIT